LLDSWIGADRQRAATDTSVFVDNFENTNAGQSSNGSAHMAPAWISCSAICC
jgi:hypothetical protein